MGKGKGQTQTSLNVKKQRELDARTAKVGELWAEGVRSVPVMAKRMGVSRNTIYRHIRRLQDRWYKEMASDANRVIGNVVAESIRILEAASKAWDESRGQIVTKRRTITADGPPPKTGDKDLRDVTTEVVEDEHFSPGDPRYLAEMRKAMELIARVTGTYQGDVNVSGDLNLNLTSVMQSIEKGRSAPVLDVESSPPAGGNGNGRPD